MINEMVSLTFGTSPRNMTMELRLLRPVGEREKQKGEIMVEGPGCLGGGVVSVTCS